MSIQEDIWGCLLRRTNAELLQIAHTGQSPLVAHALCHVQLETEQTAPIVASASQLAPLVLTPELVDALRAALAQVTVSEEGGVLIHDCHSPIPLYLEHSASLGAHR